MVKYKKLRNQPYMELNPSDVNNSVLDDIVHSVKSHGGSIPKDLNDDLMNQLKSSSLLMPPLELSEDIFRYSGDDFYYVVFSDIDKYYDYFYDEDSNPEVHPFKSIAQIIQPYDKTPSFKGIILNPGIDDFIINFDMLDKISGFKHSDEKHVHNTRELQKMRSKLNRDKKLSRFLSKSRKFNFEKFIRLSAKTYLFTYYVSVDDISHRASDGVIELDDDLGNIFIVDEFNSKCCMLFTSEKVMEPTLSFYKKRGRNIYSQIVDLKKMAEFVTTFNFDYVILNYAHENIMVPKEHFIEYSRRIKKLNKNKSDYSNYVFIV